MWTPAPRRLPTGYGLKIGENLVKSAAQIGQYVIVVERDMMSGTWRTCRSAYIHSVRKDALQMTKRGQYLVPCAFPFGWRLFRLPGHKGWFPASEEVVIPCALCSTSESCLNEKPFLRRAHIVAV
jgi:hypothetical protein